MTGAFLSALLVFQPCAWGAAPPSGKDESVGVILLGEGGEKAWKDTVSAIGQDFARKHPVDDLPVEVGDHAEGEAVQLGAFAVDPPLQGA